MVTKLKMVQDYLNNGKTLTSLQAIKMFNLTRLSAAIYKLKKAGIVIDCKMIRIANSVFAEYRQVYHPPVAKESNSCKKQCSLL